MKAVTSAFDENDRSQSKLNQTMQVLNKQIDNQKSKLDLLRQKLDQQEKELAETAKAYQKTAEEQGKDSTAAQKLANEMANQERQISQTKTEINNATTALNNMETELRETGNAMDTANAKTVNYKEEVEKLGQKLKDVGEKLMSVGKSMTTYVTAPIIAAFTLASKTASDYEENLNKIEVAFGDNADAVTQWANTALKEFGLSKVAATDAVSAFGALAKGVGLSSKEAADMSITLAGLTSDLASYFNTSTDTAATALEGIFTGQAQALKKFGVVMTEVNLKEFAADQGLVYSELSQTEKTLLRYNYVLAQTADAQGDYARTSDGTANSLKTFKAALSDLATTIGTQLLPIITPVIQKASEIIQKFSEMSPKTKKIIVIFGLIAAAIGPLLTAIGALSIGLAALTGPFGMVIAIIAAVVTAIGWLVANWGDLKESAKETVDWIVNKWNELKEKATGIWNGIKDKATSAMNAIKTNTQNHMNAIKNTFNSAGGGIKGVVAVMWSGIQSAYSAGFNALNSLTGGRLGQITNAIRGAFSSLASAAYAWGRDIIQNIVNGITSMISRVTSAVSGVANTVKRFLHFSEPDEGPLADFNTWMPDMMRQMAEQIEAGRGLVQRAASDVAGDIAAAMYVSGGTGASSSTYNYGGISINVAAGNQSPSSIADAVMLRIQEATQRKVAIWQ